MALNGSVVKLLLKVLVRVKVGIFLHYRCHCQRSLSSRRRNRFLLLCCHHHIRSTENDYVFGLGNLVLSEVHHSESPLLLVFIIGQMMTLITCYTMLVATYIHFLCLILKELDLLLSCRQINGKVANFDSCWVV